MKVIARDNIDVAIVYAGNPCQLAIVHALGIPFIYFDLNGFTDETRIAAQMSWNSNLYPGFNSTALLSHFVWQTLQTFWQRITHFSLLTCEFLMQNGAFELIQVFPCSKRYLNLDIAISLLFKNDYDIKAKFKTGFPDVNEV